MSIYSNISIYSNSSVSSNYSASFNNSINSNNSLSSNNSVLSSNVSSLIGNLPLTDPRCNNDSCTAFEVAHNLSQATVSYAQQIEYGHWVAWYYAIIIFIFALIHVYHRLGPSASTTQLPNVFRAARSKALAAGRYLTYRRARGYAFDGLHLPSFGVVALLLLSILFVGLLTFTARPYYREHRGFGSPPLAVRAGLMAAACLPLIVALSGKANLITLLTGYGYERLNVFHRWLGWVFFVLSVIHAVPYIVAPLRDGGYTALHKQFYREGSSEVCRIIWFISLPVLSFRFFFSLSEDDDLTYCIVYRYRSFSHPLRHNCLLYSFRSPSLLRNILLSPCHFLHYLSWSLLLALRQRR